MQFIIEAFVLGILYGTGPCTLSCAPVMVPIIMSYSKSGIDGIRQSLIFSLGRIASYSLLGMLSGFIGSAITKIATKEITAAIIITFGVLIILKRYPKKCKFICKIKGKHTSFTSGVLLGLSPCYPLLGILSLAALSGSPIIGLAMGIVFGIGTLITPLVLLGFFAGKWASFSKEFMSINLIITGGFLILLGILMFI
ncbi:MAG: sulfite exporter TauE/SafE family protein [Candidatus Aenigmatarchaeota archaeon]